MGHSGPRAGLIWPFRRRDRIRIPKPPWRMGSRENRHAPALLRDIGKRSDAVHLLARPRSSACAAGLRTARPLFLPRLAGRHEFASSIAVSRTQISVTGTRVSIQPDPSAHALRLEACLATTVRFYQRTADQQRIGQHQAQRLAFIQSFGDHLARFYPRRRAIEPLGDGLPGKSCEAAAPPRAPPKGF